MIRCSGSLSILIYSFLFVLAAIKSYSLSLVETLTPNSFITAGCREKDWGSQKSNPGPRGDLPSVPATNIKPHRVSTTQTVSFKRFIKKKLLRWDLNPELKVGQDELNQCVATYPGWGWKLCNQIFLGDDTWVRGRFLWFPCCIRCWVCWGECCFLRVGPCLP